MDITLIPVKELKLNERNPRKIDKVQFDKLCLNILNDPEYFKMRPCLVNKIDNELVVYAGNQRLRAAKKNGMTEVPCIVEENIPEDILRKRIVVDNIHNGEHDYDMLSSLYTTYELIELGFTSKELHLDGLNSLTDDEGDKEEPCKCESCGQKIRKKKK